MKREWNRILAVGVVALCLPTQAAVNLVANGSFEAPIANQAFDTINTSQLDGWTITREDGASSPVGTVDLIKSYWQPAHGQQSLDLAGEFTAARISQNVATVTGHEYRLTFALAGNPDQSYDKILRVYWGDTQTPLTTITFSQAGHTRSDMGWQYYSLTVFGGAGGSTYLAFADGGPVDNAWGAALDNVSVVPEASTYAAGLGALLILGFSAWNVRRAR
jgi:choice-of-anchor C domain-containing protein